MGEKETPGRILNTYTTKFLRLYQSIDRQVSSKVRNGGVTTRPADSNGLWCCMLLPAILVLYSIQAHVTLEYTVTACVSVGLLFHSLLFILFVSVSSEALMEKFDGACVACSMIPALLIYGLSGQGLLSDIALAGFAVGGYSLLLKHMLHGYPKTFTIGEATIVSQGIVLAATRIISGILVRLNYGGEELDFVNTVVSIVLLSLVAMITYISMLKDEDRTLMRLHQTVLLTVGFIFITLHMFLGLGFIIHFLVFLIRDNTRVRILCACLVLVAVAALLIALRVSSGARADTATRKSFHALATLVFLPGALADPELLRLLAGLGGGLVLFVEALRKSRIEPYSSALQAAFDVYCDDKDAGCVAVSPLYLFAGLACPLPLVPTQERLQLLSGVLATGVGDSAASWAGSRYGATRWSDNNKTMEGTACNILSQVAVVYALQVFGLLDTPNALLRATFAATVSGLVEAKTSQVDNLVLPLVTILAFQITNFFL